MTRVSPTRGPDPLAGVGRLLVDGTNLLHAMSRGPDRQPPAALIGRLRGAIPPETSIELVFDGPQERRIRGERIAGGLTVRYGGRLSADAVLIGLVEDAAIAAGARPGEGAAATDSILVVTDDRELRYAVGRRGARTAGSAWLIGRLDRSRILSPSAGNPRPPRLPGAVRSVSQPEPGQVTEDVERTPWSPGRGATRKRGNAHRTPRR